MTLRLDYAALYASAQMRYDLLEEVDDCARMKDVPEDLSHLNHLVTKDEMSGAVGSIKEMEGMKRLGIETTVDDINEIDEWWGLDIDSIRLYDLLREDGVEYEYPIELLFDDDPRNSTKYRDKMIVAAINNSVNTVGAVQYIRERFPYTLTSEVLSRVIRMLPNLGYRPYTYRKMIEW